MGQKATLDAQFPRAALAFRTAERIARAASAEVEVGRALNGAAFALLRHARFEPARETAEASVAHHQRLGDAAGEADAWNTIGGVRWARSADDSVLEAYQRALSLWTSVGNRRGMARATGNIGGIQAARGDFDEALSHQREALRLFEEVGDLRGVANTMEHIGSVYLFRGEHAEALEYFQRGLAVGERIGDRWNISRGVASVGNGYQRLGDYRRALQYMTRSLALSEEIGDRHKVADTWNNIGFLYSFMGDPERAIDAYRTALRLNQPMGNTSLEATAYNNVGDAAWSLGEHGRAEANYRAGLRIAEERGYKNLVAEALRGLGNVAVARGRRAEARGLLERALAMREALKDQDGVVQALSSLAQLDLAEKRPAEALAHARRATEIAQRFEYPELLWGTQTLAGIAQRRLGQRGDAQRSLEDAVQVIEALRVQLVGPEQGRQRFFESRLSPYYELMTLALEGGRTGEAIELAERSKARVLADLMRRGGGTVLGAMSLEDRREGEVRRAAVSALNRTIQAERRKETADAGRLASLEAQRKVKRADLESFQAAVHAKHPELAAALGGAATFRLGEAAQVLRDDSMAALEYAVTEDSSFVFVVTRRNGRPKLDWYSLGVGRRVLARRARELRARLSARDLAFSEEARRLHDLVLGPARRHLEGKVHLVIVPDGPLWDVPFQALLDPTGRYLIETAAVSYAPSLTVLREALRRTRSRAPLTVLAMGKADFGAAGAAPPLPLMSDLGPIPDAERQVRRIASLYGPERSTTYLGAEAREDRFKTEAPRHGILHLATHGVLDEASPLYSHVVLSPGQGGSSEDGLLEAWELMELRLKADIVILSACETGRGRIAPGEGIVGTMWAAFIAGSGALLASQWKVEAQSTTELMTAFHRGLAGGEGGKAALLRRASLEVLRQPSYAHPFYWAGFILVGNPY